MAAVPVRLPDGTTGTVAPSDVDDIGEGGRVLTPEEHARAIKDVAANKGPETIGEAAGEYGESILAGMHAHVRGELEAGGIPLDQGIKGIASLFGGEEAAKKTGTYLKELDEKHPVLTGLTGLQGNIAGAIGIAELTGGLGNPLSLKALAQPRTIARVAARAGMGGTEAVVTATTRDINEAALGNHAINGEKLLAAAPGRFLMGAALTGGFEVGAHVLGKGLQAAKRTMVPTLEAGADRAVGREVGVFGAESEEVGKRVRGFADGKVPGSRAELADILGAEQAAQRGRQATEHAGIVDALAGEQTAEMGALSMRQEAARKVAAREGARGVEAAEGAAADTHFEGMARGGARVEQAELEGYAKRSAAHGDAFERNMASATAEGRASPASFASEAEAAGASVQEVTSHYSALRKTLQEEHAVATRHAEELAAERAANAKELEGVLKEVQKAGASTEGKLSELRRTRAPLPKGPTKEQLIAYRQGTGPKPPPAQGKMGYGMRGADDEFAMESQSALAGVGEKVERLQALDAQLAKAHEEALAHVGTVEKAAATTERQAAKDMMVAKRAAEARMVTFQKTTSKEAARASQMAEQAAEHVRDVEAQTVAAVEKARAVGQKEADAAKKAGDKEVAQARAQAEAIQANAEKIAARERGALEKEHGREIRALPKVNTKTDVDPLLKHVRAPQEAPPFVSPGAAWGAGAAMLHGNPVAAAATLAASFAAGRLRGQGNLAAARALRGVSQALTHVDSAIQKGTMRILGRAGGRAVSDAENRVGRASGKLPKFEDVAAELYAAQANPMILERRVSAGLGQLAKDAPNTYVETLASTQRAHAFLLSILPPPQTDPHSLTPQFDSDLIDESTKYEFMQSYGTIVDPLSIYGDVENKSVTEQQVTAIQEVYPTLYDQMRAEVERQKLFLTEPIEYDRAIHVGTLLGVLTDEVLEDDFQVALATNYEEKEEAGQPVGSKSGASKATENMKSGSEGVEGGM